MTQLSEKQEAFLQELVDRGLYPSVDIALQDLFDQFDAFEEPDSESLALELAQAQASARNGEGHRFSNAREAQAALHPDTLAD